MHATGNASLFPWLIPVRQGGEVRAANGHQLAVRGFGPVVMENFRVNNVLCSWPHLQRHLFVEAYQARLQRDVLPLWMPDQGPQDR